MRAVGPIADPVPCSGCGKLLDPLRAGHIAIFDAKLHYFCDRSACREAYLAPGPRSTSERISSPSEAPRPKRSTPVPAPTRGTPPPPFAAPIASALAPAVDDEPLPALPSLGDEPATVEPLGQTILSEPAVHPRQVTDTRDGGTLLLLMAVVAGTLAIALGLAERAPIVLIARIVLVAVGAGMLVGRAATTERDPADVHPLALLAAPVLGVPLSIWASLGEAPLGAEMVSLTGTIVSANAVGTWLLETARDWVRVERSWIESSLDALLAPLDEASEGERASSVLAVGDEVLVEEGGYVPVDLTVSDHEADVLPWLGATTPLRRRPGDAIVAGAQVVEGKLRGRCTFIGNDRAFCRVLLDPRRRADVLAPVVRTARSLAQHWAIAVAASMGLLGLALGRSVIEACAITLAVHAGVASGLLASLAGVHVTRGILLGLRRGITYRSTDAWERAARAAVAVFCARGTLLLGEPEVAEVEPLRGQLEPSELLSLAAGAERTERHPVASAIVRAVRGRGLRPDGVRNVSKATGFGVTGITSSGEEIAVGSRALMLDVRVSVAEAERRIAELEALGRSVILVALGGRLVGLIALQDGLRPGARAAVQHLLDAQVEPVLLSGDARETCEAIARALDIEHVRPEIAPADRAAEVKHLAEAGASVAVLGHVGTDDAALAAGDIGVALGSAGSAAEHGIALASEDVRDAALALALARRTRAEARASFTLTALPALAGSLVVGLSILPPVFVPLAALLGGALAVGHSRAIDRERTPPPPEPELGDDAHGVA